MVDHDLYAVLGAAFTVVGTIVVAVLTNKRERATAKGDATLHLIDRMESRIGSVEKALAEAIARVDKLERENDELHTDRNALVAHLNLIYLWLRGGRVWPEPQAATRVRRLLDPLAFGDGPVAPPEDMEE